MTKKRKKPKANRTKLSLTMKQMLARIPKKTWLTTEDVAHVFDAHPVTISRMKTRGELPSAYRTNNRGAANLYKPAEIAAAVRRRYEPQPAPGNTKIRDTDSDQGKHDKDATGTPRRSGRKAANPTAKPKARRRAKSKAKKNSKPKIR